MNFRFRGTALALACAVMAAFAGGCSENDVQPSKNPYDDGSSSAEQQQEASESVHVNGLIDNVDDSSATGKVYSQTIMVYMVGSDLESGYGAATRDLAEMQDALPIVGDNRVVVCAGGASRWKNDVISPYDQTILELKDGGFEVANTGSSQNMGEAENLQNFISECMSHYNTDLYSLILWNHGGGPVIGYGVDENYNDVLNIIEMQEALENSVGKSGKKLEWIGFDACLMSSLEICDAFEPYTNYLIASQETEPGWGWNYEFLSSLSEPDMDGAHLGKKIIDTYMDFGEMVFEQKPSAYADLTLACLDLGKYSGVETNLNQFFAENHGKLNEATFAEAYRRRGRVKVFGTYSSDYNYSLADATDLVDQLADNTSAVKGELKSAIGNMIVYMRTNVDKAGGVSICYPYGAEEDYSEVCLLIDEKIGFADEYVKYLKDFDAIHDGEPIVSEWNISDAEGYVSDYATPVSETEEYTEPATEAETEPETEAFTEAATEAELIQAASSGKDISLKLTDEQKANFGSAKYYILCKVKGSQFEDFNKDDPRLDDMYLFIHGGKNVQMDSTGTLHAYYSNNVVYMKDKTTNELSSIPMILVDNDSSSKEKRYFASVVLFNWTGEDIDIEDWRSEAAQLQIVVDSNHPNGEIRSAVPINGEDEIKKASKQLFSLDDFTLMSVAGRCSYITRNDQGRLIDFFDWEKTGIMMGFDQDLTHDYALEVTSLQNPENLYCMFTVSDSQGKTSTSELIPLA